MRQKSRTPDGAFLRELAARLRQIPSQHGVSVEDAERLVSYAERWDELYDILDATARLKQTPGLLRPNTG